MTKTVNVYLFGKRYAVPENLTIMTAMEYAGYQLKRGCGCPGYAHSRDGFPVKKLFDGHIREKRLNSEGNDPVDESRKGDCSQHFSERGAKYLPKPSEQEYDSRSYSPERNEHEGADGERQGQKLFPYRRFQTRLFSLLLVLLRLDRRALSAAFLRLRSLHIG